MKDPNQEGGAKSRPLPRWLTRPFRSDTAILNLTALVVGLGAGFGAIGFGRMINFFRDFSFGQGAHLFGFLDLYYVILIPALGGLIVGPLVYFFAREAKGHGVPEVMEAVALKGGRIRPRVVVIKALASSICIGSGGAAGREGPIVQIGSALGSTLGQLFRMSEGRIRTLVACGAAGGISATFNAPVAGVFFALEIILGEFTIAHFAPVVISAVAASVIARVFLGDHPAFEVPEHVLGSPTELVLFVVLAALAALVAVAFMKILYFAEDLFDDWKFPPYLKPVIGGLAVGVIGVWYPQVFGVGYESIEGVLHGEVIFGTTAVLVVAKLLATSFTLGSGGSGGVFAPSLFMGAMLGGAFGDFANRILGGGLASPGAYAVVGMAAMFAAGARAPMSAIVIVFEMTGDYRVILPLMLATAVATLLATALERESIYTLKLSRRGTHLRRGRDIDIMRSVRVEDVMDRDTRSVPASLGLTQLVESFEESRRHALPVVDEAGELLGVVSLQDLDWALSDEKSDSLTVGDIASRKIEKVYPDDDMMKALERMGPRDLSSLPVVDRRRPGRLLGVVRRRDIVRAYNLARTQRHEVRQQIDRLQGEVPGARFAELVIPSGSPLIGRKLMEIRLPKDSVMVSVERGTQVIIPRGETTLQADDRVTIFVKADSEQAVREMIER